MFRMLIDERGPWSAFPFPNNNETHWKLDKTEDNWRRRPKLKRNYKFDVKLCHPQKNKSSNQPNQQIEESSSSKGSNFPEQMKYFLLKGVRGITEEKLVDQSDESVDINSVDDSSLISSSSENKVSDYVNYGNDNADIVRDRKDIQSVSAETESDEVLKCCFVMSTFKNGYTYRSSVSFPGSLVNILCSDLTKKKTCREFINHAKSFTFYWPLFS